MIKLCAICGKPFEGKANATLCSGVCRLEYKKQYMAHYRNEHKDKISEQKSKWYHRKRGTKFVPKMPILPPEEQAQIEASNGKEYYIASNSKIICQESAWGRCYLRQKRLDQLVMLSSELSRLGIAKITYGYLSAIRDFDRHRYLTLLKAVVDAKEDKL